MYDLKHVWSKCGLKIRACVMYVLKHVLSKRDLKYEVFFMKTNLNDADSNIVTTT